MAKKYVLLFALIAVLGVAGTIAVSAEDNSTTTATTPTATPPVLGSKKLDLVCMRTAVEKRETAIITALDSFSTAMKTAVQARKDALLAAWQIEKARDRALAITKAHKDFQRAKITAKNVYNKARVAAWRQFTTDRKTCGAGPTGENMNNDTL